MQARKQALVAALLLFTGLVMILMGLANRMSGPALLGSVVLLPAVGLAFVLRKQGLSVDQLLA